MANVFELKEQVTPETPLLLVDCEFGDGPVEHWSTHRVQRGEVVYEARVLRHNLFEMETSSEQGVDGILMNTALAAASDPVRMATAMRAAVEAGRLAYLAGRMPRREVAVPSSPTEGLLE